MMIRKERFGDVLDVMLEGRLDTIASRLVAEELEQSYHGLHELNLDIRRLEYISSAGLRVLLDAKRRMSMQGIMTVSQTTQQVQNILDATGFAELFAVCG